MNTDVAYLSNVEYDRGGRVRTLEGDVMYDNGGRVRHLLGESHLGQTDVVDLPLTSADNWSPILSLPDPVPSTLPDNWYQPGPLESAPITGSLTPPPNLPSSPGTVVDLTNAPFHPDLQFPLQSAPITGSLTPPAPPAPAIITGSSIPAATGVIAAIGNVFKSIFGGPTVQAGGPPVVPTSGHVTAAGQALAATGQLVSPSWFTDPAQEIVHGVPNWGVAAGVGVLGIALFGGGAKYASSRGGPRRRRNPAELLLMGANPCRRRRAR